MKKQEFLEYFTEALSNTQVKDIFVSLFMDTIVKPVQAEISELKEELKERDSKIEHLEGKNKFLQTKILSLQRRVEKMERDEKENNIVIDGIPETHGENLDDKMQKLFKDKMGIEVESNEFATIKRLGRTPNPIEGSKRKILVTFKRLERKQQVYQKKHVFKPTDRKRKQEIFINEDLPNEKAEVLFKLRKEKKNEKIHAVWLYKGKIHVKLFENDRPQIIEDTADLNQFLQWMEIQRSSHSIPAE